MCLYASVVSNLTMELATPWQVRTMLESSVSAFEKLCLGHLDSLDLGLVDPELNT